MTMKSVTCKRAVVHYVQNLAKLMNDPRLEQSRREHLILDGIEGLKIAIKIEPGCADSYGMLELRMCMARNLNLAHIEESEIDKIKRKGQELINRNRERIRKNPPPGIPAKPRKKAA